MRTTKGCVFSIGMLTVLLLSFCPTATADPESLPFSGAVLDSDGFGINNLVVTITNYETDQSMDTTTDEFGEWSMDLDEIPGGWEPGDWIETSIEDASELLYEFGVVATEKAGGFIQDVRKFLSLTKPESVWYWDYSVPTGYISGSESKFRWVADANVVADTYTFEVRMKFRDDRTVGKGQVDGTVKMRFWISDSNNKDYQTNLFPAQHISSWTTETYDEAPFDTQWKSKSKTVDVPQGLKFWFLVFENQGWGMHDDFPAFVFGGWEWSNCAQWSTIEIV